MAPLSNKLEQLSEAEARVAGQLQGQGVSSDWDHEVFSTVEDPVSKRLEMKLEMKLEGLEARIFEAIHLLQGDLGSRREEMLTAIREELDGVFVGVQREYGHLR